MTTILQTISDGANDAREKFTGGSFGSTSTAIAVFSNSIDSNRFMGGFRFTGLTIPTGATIDAGTKMQVVFLTLSKDSPDTVIHCEDVDSAVSFVTNADVQARPRTTASVTYVAVDEGSGSYVDTPDIDTEVQEVVDRGGWASGNDIVVMIIGGTATDENTEIFAVEHANNLPAKIVIEYTVAPAGRIMGSLAGLGGLAGHGGIAGKGGGLAA